jgi:hypothetical protein
MRDWLFTVLVAGRWKVAPQVHAVVQDAPNFDDHSWSYPVQKEVTSATTISRDVERAEALHDLVSGLRASNVGTIGKFADRLNERVPVESGLPRAEILSSPFEDICEVELCGRAEANAPFPLDHEAAIRLFWK